MQDAEAPSDAEVPERDAGMMPDARLPGPDFCDGAERIVTQGYVAPMAILEPRREYGEGPDVWFTFTLERATRLTPSSQVSGRIPLICSGANVAH